MADVEVHALEATVGFSLTHCDVVMTYSVLFDDCSDMPVIENHQKDSEARIGRDEEEAVEDEAFEVERKGVKCGLIFLHQVEKDCIGDKGSEQHVDHED